MGNVEAIIGLSRRAKFGYIKVGDGEDSPRAYFSFSQLADRSVTLRKGYNVSFECKVDDKERQYASNIELTEEGKKQLVEREAQIAELKAKEPPVEKKPKEKKGSKEAKDAQGSEEKKAKRTRKRKAKEPKMVKLSVSCDGFAETKEIEFNAYQSIGRLKKIATAAFGAEPTFQVFKDDALLTKALLVGMDENGSVHLGPPKENTES